MVSAVGQRVAVVYQYDYNGTATDWKTSGTGGDFDIIATLSLMEGQIGTHNGLLVRLVMKYYHGLLMMQIQVFMFRTS